MRDSEKLDPVVEFARRFDEAVLRRGFSREVPGNVSGGGILLWTRDADLAAAPRIFLSAGIHGDEPCAPEALVQLLEGRDLPRSFHWVVAPLLNPSGFRLATREEAGGLDLNRDFLRKRSSEVRCLTDWWLRQERRPSLHFSLHEDWEAEGLYLYEINTSARPTLAPTVLKLLEGVVPIQQEGPVDGHELSAPGLILHSPDPDDEEGWPEAIWLARNFPVQSVTFEAPGLLSPAKRVACLITALAGAIDEVESIALGRGG